MGKDFGKVSKGLNLDPQSGTPTSLTDGDVWYESGAFKFRQAGSTEELGSGGISWVTVTGASQSVAVGTGYIADRTSTVTFTLPASSAVGDTFIVVGKGIGGWRIGQNSGQYIVRDTIMTTPGTSGYLSSSHYKSCVELVCTIANTEWTVMDSQGATTQSGGAAKGYLMGGFNGSAATNTIEDLVFATETSDPISATITSATFDTCSFSSPTKGYVLGGSASSTAIRSLTFSGETFATSGNALSTAVRDGGTGVQSSTKGYIMGMDTNGSGNRVATIVAVLFSADTASDLAATLDTAKQSGAGVCSTTKGYIMGGFTGSNVTVIEDLDFNTETSAAIAATLGTARNACVGTYSTTKGYCMGGNTGSNSAIIDDLNFAMETSDTLAATLSVARSTSAAASSALKGYNMSGNFASGRTTSIESISFSAETTATLSATINTAVGETTGVQGG